MTNFEFSSTIIGKVSNLSGRFSGKCSCCKAVSIQAARCTPRAPSRDLDNEGLTASDKPREAQTKGFALVPWLKKTGAHSPFREIYLLIN